MVAARHGMEVHLTATADTKRKRIASPTRGEQYRISMVILTKTIQEMKKESMSNSQAQKANTILEAKAGVQSQKIAIIT